MLIQEYPYKNDERLVRTFSDSGKMLLQNETGVKYSEAVDVHPCRYTYSELDESAEQ